MKNLRFLIITGACLAMLSCKKEINPELAKAGWIKGKWENKVTGGRFTETWTQENDSVFKGESFFIEEKEDKSVDTTFAEYIDLAVINGVLTYTVSVKNQNGEKPVPFRLTSATEKQLVFENPKHDFPDKIVYTKINNDSIVAEISGLQNGRDAHEVFPLKRQK